MPKVGGKHFAYTPSGKAAAKAAAKKSGKPIQYLAKGKGAVPTTEKKGSGGVMPVGPVKKGR